MQKMHLHFRMDMVVSAGKSRKNVDAFILLPPDARTAIDLLIETKAAVGVPTTNQYVFARLHTDTPLTGNSELQEIVQQCPGVRCFERITLTLLRRYIATVSQVCYKPYCNWILAAYFLCTNTLATLLLVN